MPTTSFRLAFLGAVGLAALPSAPLAAQVYDDSPMAKAVDKLIGGPRWGSVSTFDVAGVRLGMTPDEARAGLRRAGFVPKAQDPEQDSFASVVSQRAVERIGGSADRTKVPMFTTAKGSQGESVEVWYAATRDGARATEVKYVMPADRMTGSAFSQGVVAKYGKPTFAQGSQSIYCTKPEKVCASYASLQLPYLTAEPNPSSNHVVDLRMGRRYDDGLKAERAAAVEATAPKNAKASF